jgi:FAD/FMN-containing dehydrogenase
MRPGDTVRPGSAEEVAAVVRECYARRLPLVPLGAGTGFARGHETTGAEVVVDLGGLDRVRSFDPLLWRMEAEAGVALRTVQRLARENGLHFPVDPGAAELSHVGGAVATNAGGPHTFKYGSMRAWVLGLEAVLAPGELVRIGGPVRKDVAGYDLVSLLCGSEGTLGIVTAAWLRLAPAPAGSWPVVARAADAAALQAGVEQALASGVTPSALEFLDATSARAAGREGPMLIAEADGGEHERDALVEAIGGAPADPAELWRWREGVAYAVEALEGAKLSEDVCVPVDRLAELLDGHAGIAARHGLTPAAWGHAGDGNVHATFCHAPGDAARAERAAQDLFALAIDLGGTITGEHGIGLAKAGWLERQWPPAAVAAQEAIKRTLDPLGLLNPGKKAARPTGSRASA